MPATTVQRCDTCHQRHKYGDECPEPGEEGYITRAELIDAFRCGLGVCLHCQAVWHATGPAADECPICDEPRERFDDDDLKASA